MTYDPSLKENRLELAQAIENYFDFSKWTTKSDNVIGCRERVYSFQLKHYEKAIPVRIQIYTSIDIDSGECRKEGKTAIRILAIRRYKNGSVRGFLKHRRINQVGSIETIINRLDKAIAFVQEKALIKWTNPIFCPFCGEDTFITKTGKNACLVHCQKRKTTNRKKRKK